MNGDPRKEWLRAGGSWVAVLGPVMVETPTETRRFSGRRSDLLTMLAYTPEPRPTERVAEELFEGAVTAWPSALRNYFTQFEKLGGGPLVQSEKGSLCLNPERVRTDVELFRALVSEADEHARRNRCGDAERGYASALGLIRGTNAMSRYAPHAVLAIVASLEQLRCHAEEGLAEAQLALGLAPEILVRLREAAHAHPDREIRWHQLMRGLYQSGLQREACNTFDVARQALAEYGVVPSPPLVELSSRIVTQDVSIRGRTSAGTTALPPPLRPSGEHFVGRTEAIRRIEEADAALILVVGPGSIGKSTLLAHLAQRRSVSIPGLEVCYASCDPFDELPLAAVHRAFGTDEDEVIRPDAIVRRELAGPGPRRLVILDDVHLADDATMAFIRHAARTPLRTGSAVVAAGRITDTIRAVAAVPGVVVVRLDSLTRSELSDLPEAAEEIDQLFAESGGWPLLLQLGRRLRAIPPVASASPDGPAASPDAASSRAAERTVTSDMREIVARLLEPFEPADRRILTIAALLGVRIEPPALAVAADVSLAATSAAIDAAHAAGIVLREAGRFRNEMLPVAIAGLLPDEDRRLAHSEIARRQRLEPDRRAIHALAAVPVIEAKEAVEMARVGRAHALGANRFATAGELAEGELAVRIAFGQGLDEDLCSAGDRIELLVAAAEAWERSGRSIRAELRRSEAFELAEAEGDFLWAAEAAGAEPSNGRSMLPTATLDRVRRALALAPADSELDDDSAFVRLRLHAEHETLRGLRGLVETNDRDNELLEMTIDQPVDARSEAIALRAWLYSNFARGPLGKRTVRSARLLELSAVVGDPVLRAESLTLATRSHLELGDVRSAERIVARERRAWAGSTRPVDVWAYHLARCSVEYCRGELTAAAQSARHASAVTDRFEIADGAAARFAHGLVFALLGRPDLRAEFAPPLSPSSDDDGDDMDEMDLASQDESPSLASVRFAALSCIAATDGRADLAAHWHGRACTRFDAGAGDPVVVPAAALIAQASWLTHRRATDGVRRVLAAAGESQVILGLNPTAVLGPALRYLAQLDALDGEPIAAIRFAESAAWCQERGLLAWAAVSLEDLATHRQQTDDPTADATARAARTARRRCT